MTSRSRVLAFHGITWCLIAVVSIVAAEVALRMSHRVTVESVATATADVFDAIPGVFAPGQAVVERPRPELEHRVSINSMGYRGPEIEAENRNGAVRMLCVGDSFTYGSYVDDDATLPAQLQRALRAMGYPVDVINAGVGGTTIVDQLFLLKKSARVDVDVVVLVFSENDVGDLAKDEPLYRALERNRRLKTQPGARQIYSLVRNTALFHLALDVRGWYEGRGSGEADRVNRVEDVERVERLWRQYDTLLGEVQTYVATRGARFAFVIFPSHYRIDARAHGDDRLDHVGRLATRRGVRTINLLEPLRAAGEGAARLYLLPYDGHPSSRGYAVAAKAVALELEGDVRDAANHRRQRLGAMR